MRLVALSGALCLIDSGFVTDLIGSAVLTGLVAVQYVLSKREAAVLGQR